MNGSPYEAFKNVVFDAMFYDNFTLDSEFILRFDGEVVAHGLRHESVGNNRSLFVDSPNRMSVAYTHRHDRILSFRTSEVSLMTCVPSPCGRAVYRLSVSPYSQHWVVTAGRAFIPHTLNLGGDRYSAETRIKELALDLLVSDLRNNVNMTTQSDGTRKFYAAITGNQLPEIGRVLVDMRVEADYARASNFVLQDYHIPVDIPIRSLEITRLYTEAIVDSTGNLTYIRMGMNADVVNMFGSSHEINVEQIFHFTELGTSNPQNPIPNLLETFTPDFLDSNFGIRYSTIQFMLDDYGNIDMDSIGFFGHRSILAVVCGMHLES